MIEIDRSRIVAYQRCPRERYIGYHLNGKGLQRRAKALPLQFGAAFHEGSADLLLGRGIEAAVLKAQLFLSNEFTKFAIDLGDVGDDQKAQIAYSIEEQGALAEALLRAWWIWDGQAFLETFEILEVEEEGRAVLLAKQGQLAVYEGDPEMVLMYRPDALVRDRFSGDYYVLSWKTAAVFNKRTTAQCRHDMQSMSEVWGLQDDVEQNVGDMTPFKDFRIEGVLYKFIVKGKRDKDEWDGLYKQNSHLIYGWHRVGPGGCDDEEWAWTYKWQTEELNEKTGKMKSTTLGKGWKKVPIWRDYPGGVEAWVNDLAANQIQPRHISALNAVFPQQLPVDRRPDEVAKWKRQTIAQELKVAADLKEVDLNPDNLDILFPQYSHSCEAYSGCQFRAICWDNIPAEEGELYQIRQANHPELEGGEEDD